MRTIKMILIGALLGLTFTYVCKYTMITPNQSLELVKSFSNQSLTSTPPRTSLIPPVYNPLIHAP